MICAMWVLNLCFMMQMVVAIKMMIFFLAIEKEYLNLPLTGFAGTHAQCLQHSSSGMGTIFGIWLTPHFKSFGGFGETGQDGRHSTFPRSQKQCCSQPVKFAGISLQLSKCCPLYSHDPLSMQRIFSGIVREYLK